MATAPPIELPLSKMPLTCCLDLHKLEPFHGIAFSAPLTARNSSYSPPRPRAGQAAAHAHAQQARLPLRRPGLHQPRHPKRAASASALRPTMGRMMGSESVDGVAVARHDISASSLRFLGKEDAARPFGLAPAAVSSEHHEASLVKPMARPKSASALSGTGWMAQWETMAPESYLRYRQVEHGKLRDTSSVLRADFDADAPQAVRRAEDAGSGAPAPLGPSRSGVNLLGLIKYPAQRSGSVGTLETRGYLGGLGGAVMSRPTLSPVVSHYICTPLSPSPHAYRSSARALRIPPAPGRRLGLHAQQMKGI